MRSASLIFLSLSLQIHHFAMILKQGTGKNALPDSGTLRTSEKQRAPGKAGALPSVPMGTIRRGAPAQGEVTADCTTPPWPYPMACALGLGSEGN